MLSFASFSFYEGPLLSGTSSQFWHDQPLVSLFFLSDQHIPFVTLNLNLFPSAPNLPPPKSVSLWPKVKSQLRLAKTCDNLQGMTIVVFNSRATNSPVIQLKTIAPFTAMGGHAAAKSVEISGRMIPSRVRYTLLWCWWFLWYTSLLALVSFTWLQ